MTNPKWGIWVGLIASMGSGAMTPIFGIVLIKVTFSLNIIYGPDYVREQADKYCLYMFLMAVGAFLFTVISKFAFGALGENVTHKIRRQMYSSILQKHTGWFDDKENTPGVLSTSLASDAQVINGVSAEGLASIVVAAFSVCTGIVIGFIYSW